MSRNIKLGYIASGSGSSVEKLASKIQDGTLKGFESRVILCNKPKGEASIYERAGRLRIPVYHTPNVEKQIKVLKGFGVDIVLGLGYIRKIEGLLLKDFEDKVLNIHPTLLPNHGGKGMYGLATHLAVLAAGDTTTGPTVHLMNEQYDKGRILQQNKISIPSHLIGKSCEDNALELQHLVLQEEYKIMQQVLEGIRDKTIEIGKF